MGCLVVCRHPFFYLSSLNIELMGKSGSHLFIERLKKNAELLEVKARISPELEITEVTDRFSKQDQGGKAVLVTKKNKKKVALGGKDPDTIAGEIDLRAR